MEIKTVTDMVAGILTHQDQKALRPSRVTKKVKEKAHEKDKILELPITVP